MGSFSLAMGLSLLFGCFLLGLVGELYYLLWWKRRFTNRENQDLQSTNNATELSNLFCWKQPIFGKSSQRQELPISVKIPANNVNGHHEQDFQLKNYGGEESVESELMRLHNLCGPPRFLFTIKEETKEDLESDDGKGSRKKSLGDLLAYETPYMTPLASPNLKSMFLDSYNHHGFNPLFESSTDAEIDRLRSSPPPKFKFLRDAEEKLLRKLMEAAERKCQLNWDTVQDSGLKIEEKDDSFVTVVVSKSKQREEIHQQLQQNHSSGSQVLPLANSPSAFRPLDKKSTVPQLELTRNEN